jgi:predicted RNA-binding Zn-ribbon protein involved in translation (DUF1610 family)
MALERCPDCGEQVSSSAPACPHCGRPIAVSGARCPFCHASGVGRVRGLQGPLEVLGGIVLLLAFIVPGIVYYIVMESIPYCTSCGRRVPRRLLRKDARHASGGE